MISRPPRKPGQGLSILEKIRLTFAGTAGGTRSKWYMTYGAEASGSKLSIVVEYEVPVPVLGKLAEVVVRRQNEKELELALSNVKAHVEAP